MIPLKIFTKKLLEIVIVIILKNKKKRRKNDIEINKKKIPQRKLVLKKDSVKVIQGIFPKETNKQHTILKM